MAGGIWYEQNKVRPGFYLRFTRNPERKLFAERGVVAIPLCLDYGPVGEILTLERGMSDDQVLKLLGHTLSDAPLLLIKEAFKHARRVLLYRVGTGAVKASLALEGLTVTAKHPGSRGNDIQITVLDDADDDDARTLQVWVDGVKRESLTAKTVEGLGASSWVDFAGTGAITAEAGGALSGGSNGAATVNDYADFCEKLESKDFNCVGFPVDDEDVKALAVSFTRRMIEQEGKLIQCVLTDCDADYEAVSSVNGGVVLKDGTRLSPAQAVVWFAAASAAAEPYESLTYARYEDAVAPLEALSGAAIIEHLNQGHIVFAMQKDADGNDIVVVERDVNTLRTFTVERPIDWRKNRVLRALYQFGSDMYMVWHRYYVGKVSNNFRGRELYKGDVVKNLKVREEQGVFLEGAFDPLEDITVEQGEERDAVVAAVRLTPVDAMEKMYMTIEVA